MDGWFMDEWWMDGWMNRQIIEEEEGWKNDEADGQNVKSK